jgi:hypothetical protein
MNTLFRELMRRVRHAATFVLLAAWFAIAVPANGFAANIVVEWNATAIATALAAGQGPVPQTRSMAIVAVAVNDAVNAISGSYPTYGVTPLAPSQSSAEAAAWLARRTAR